MSQAPAVQRVAESIIRGSCRRLPDEQRAERCQEWSAELPAILCDSTVRPGFMRAVRALTYSAGIATTTVRLRRTAAGPGRTPPPDWRNGALHISPASMAVRAAVGLVAWLAVIFAAVLVLRAFPGAPGWPIALILALAVGFAGFCLADIARADSVRWLPKWAWAIICVIQIPGGGIIYLSFGRIGRPGPVSPGQAVQDA